MSEITLDHIQLSKTDRVTRAQLIQDADRDTKRLAFEMLDLKVYATREKVAIMGIIPVELATTEQTSASLLTGA
jgi:hypothetical protein